MLNAIGSFVSGDCYELTSAYTTASQAVASRAVIISAKASSVSSRTPIRHLLHNNSLLPRGCDTEVCIEVSNLRRAKLLGMGVKRQNEHVWGPNMAKMV